MTQAAPAAWPADGAQLLEPSIGYALGVVLAVTPELLSRPTPCSEWDLRMLLRHASESLAAFGEGIKTGHVGLNPAAEDGDLEHFRSSVQISEFRFQIYFGFHLFLISYFRLNKRTQRTICAMNPQIPCNQGINLKSEV